MNIPTGTPLTITAEAEAHVDALGMRAELERMLEHAVQTVPDLRQIRVVLDPPYDTGDEDAVVIEAYKPPPAPGEYDPTGREWNYWLVTTFPPDVCRHFTLLVIYGVPHGG